MKFHEKLADYVLGNRIISQHPDIAQSGISEKLESESMLILAGMGGNDNSFELMQYFDQMLVELGIKLPSKTKAAYSLIRYYLKSIITNPDKSFENMHKIHHQIYTSTDWSKQGFNDSYEFLGEEFNLEHLYTWYRELQDLEAGSMVYYYSELSEKERYKKYVQHLVEEAQKWLTRVENNT